MLEGWYQTYFWFKALVDKQPSCAVAKIKLLLSFWVRLNEQWNKPAERVKPGLLTLMKSTDAASTFEVSPRDVRTHMHAS